jgi:predicted transcriptional regulator
MSLLLLRIVVQSTYREKESDAGASKRKRFIMADKHTKRELFETLLVFASAAEADGWVIDGLNHELELLDRKRSTSKGDAKKKAEQVTIKKGIVDVLTNAEPMRATEIAKGADVSVQRASALLRQMVKDEQVVRHEDGKVTTFTLA